MAGWWFGCHFFYFPIYWVAVLIQLTNSNLFQRGGVPNHQPDGISSCFGYIFFLEHRLPMGIPISIGTSACERTCSRQIQTRQLFLRSVFQINSKSDIVGYKLQTSCLIFHPVLFSYPILIKRVFAPQLTSIERFNPKYTSMCVDYDDPSKITCKAYPMLNPHHSMAVSLRKISEKFYQTEVKDENRIWSACGWIKSFLIRLERLQNLQSGRPPNNSQVGLEPNNGKNIQKYLPKK